MSRQPYVSIARAASQGDFTSRSARPSFVSAALIVLAHVVLVAAFLNHGGMQDRMKESGPTSYIAFAFIPAPAPAQPTPADEALTITPAHRRAAPAAKLERTSAPVFTVPAAPASEAPAVTETQPAAATAQPRLDLASLRASARQIDSERVATPSERQQEQEQLRALDDSNLARAVRQAKRPDCQTKYSGGEKANLLLLIPLAIETITDKGCKW